MKKESCSISCCIFSLKRVQLQTVINTTRVLKIPLKPSCMPLKNYRLAFILNCLKSKGNKLHDANQNRVRPINGRLL